MEFQQHNQDCAEPPVTAGKELYHYQKRSLDDIFERLSHHGENYNLLFQLPTGGGKTVIFSEIARRYIKTTGRQVLILTHRIELCGQTSRMLNTFGVENKVISSEVKTLDEEDGHQCFVAMIETLNNRLNDGIFTLKKVGLVIIDEAHYNSFGKLFKFFEKSIILGVTATPLSSNINLPMNGKYRELIVGESITSLIDLGYLAKATTFSLNVNLNGLNIGTNGEYTVRSSEKLYNDENMQGRLLQSYKAHALGSKTLIFNSGINTSLFVFETFKKAGYDVRHLDNRNTATERKDVLNWFKHTPDAILTSVGILTTGFDEPTVDSIILNRATRSLTLYYQMIGRGSRIWKSKRTFTVIDLGNNLARFGKWEEFRDWKQIFRYPDTHLNSIRSDEQIQRDFVYLMPEEIRARFSNSDNLDMSIAKAHALAVGKELRPITVITASIEQHRRICLENSTNAEQAKELAWLLEDEIKYRVLKYSQCLAKTTQSYVKWLEDEYKRKLNVKLIQAYQSA